MKKEMEVCPLCNKETKSINIHLSKMKDLNHIELLKTISSEIDPLLKTDLFVEEIDEILKNKFKFSVKNSIYKRTKILYPKRRSQVISGRRTGQNNPVFTKGTINKIKETVKNLWLTGSYDDRINGMTGKIGRLNPKFNMRRSLKKMFNKICEMYHNDLKCNVEGCTFDQKTINVHHVDEDHKNFLISNLEPFCISHHMDNHYSRRKTPFVEITRSFTFDSAHNLLQNYEGKCKNLHGHTYHMDVSVKKRINDKNGMVLDFSKLDELVTKYVIDEFDHAYINDKMVGNPTAENMLVWIWEKLEKVGLLKGLFRIKIWETPNSCAEVTKDDMLNSDFYLDTYYSDLENYLKTKE